MYPRVMYPVPYDGLEHTTMFDHLRMSKKLRGNVT
jgi:hypothetical protein